jgi:UDP-N-acetylmuramate-alanine ligase
MLELITGVTFDVKNTKWNFKDFVLDYLKHNLMNALMAIAMAVNFGTQPMPLQ